MFVLLAILAMGARCPQSALVPPGFEAEQQKKPFPEALLAQFPGGWQDLFARAEALDPLRLLFVETGYRTFVAFEGRVPNSVQEICAGPFVPVDCKEWVNPFTGKPQLETERGTLGWMGFSATGTSPVLAKHPVLIATLPNWQSETLEPTTVEVPITGLPWAFDPGAPMEWKKALSIEEGLSGLFTAYLYCYGKEGTWDEVRQAFPIADKIMNPFTGKPIRFTVERTIKLPEKQYRKIFREIASQTPRGDFSILWWVGSSPEERMRAVVVSVGYDDAEWALRDKYLLKKPASPAAR